MRYTYYWSKSRDKAEEALEECYANGDISPSEQPRIEKRGGFWCITLLDRTYE